MTEKFHCTVRGTGPALLLAHGGGGSIDGNFGSIIDDLATTHTVVGPDYPGSGTTPRATGPLVLDDLADGIVAAALDAGQPRFAIVGHSLGSAVAVRAATRHPERVTGLVLTAGFAAPDNALRLTVDIWRALLDGDRLLLGRFLILLAGGREHLNAMPPDDLAAAVAARAETVPHGSPEHVEVVGNVDVRDELRAIAVPTTVVAATRDQVVDPAASRTIAAAIPGAQLVELAVGHAVGAEAPAKWLAAIRSLLARIG